MPDFQRIDPVLVEKALQAFFSAYSSTFEEGERDGMEAAIRVVFDELGLVEEYRRVGARAPGSRLAMAYLHCRAEHAEESRLISAWRSVEQGDAK